MPSDPGRLRTLDTARGAAVLVMVLVHTLHSWLTPEARQGAVWSVVRTIGGYPGTGFLFVSGLLLALSAEGRHRAGRAPGAIRSDALRRGLEVFVYALLFRLWMWASGLFREPHTLLRVDVLNCIGLSLMICAVALALPRRGMRLASCAALALGFAFLAPMTWGAAWPSWIPQPLLAYVNGRLPQSFFPLFPWAAFTAAGALTGLVLSGLLVAPRVLDPSARGRQPVDPSNRVMLAVAPVGLVVMGLAELAARVPLTYGHQDYWKTGPAFTLWKLGVVVAAFGVLAVWDRLPGPSALRLLGRHSLMVYWTHVEIVYGSLVGRFWKQKLDENEALVGYAVVMAVMLALAAGREWYDARRAAAISGVPAPA
jgi:uncharacterized membrane protein